MSKLADKIRKVTSGESSPMGFGAVQKGRAPGLLLAVEAREAGQIAAYAEAGADAVVAGRAIPVDGAAGRALHGLSLLDGAGAAQDAEPEADFVLVSAESPAAVLRWEGPGLVLSVDAGAEDSALRPVAALPVEAVVFDLPAGDGF